MELTFPKIIIHVEENLACSHEKPKTKLTISVQQEEHTLKMTHIQTQNYKDHVSYVS